MSTPPCFASVWHGIVECCRNAYQYEVLLRNNRQPFDGLLSVQEQKQMGEWLWHNVTRCLAKRYPVNRDDYELALRLGFYGRHLPMVSPDGNNTFELHGGNPGVYRSGYTETKHQHLVHVLF